MAPTRQTAAARGVAGQQNCIVRIAFGGHAQRRSAEFERQTQKVLRTGHQLKMKTLMIVVCSLSIFALGCSKPHQPDSIILQGTWRGQEMGVNGAESPSLVIRGSTLEFHGADTNEWYKATFSLREDTNPKQLAAVITECPFRQYVGKTENAIYQIQNGTLTLSGNEPGNPAVPMGFDAPGTRKIVFRK
jgi:uncharacterized protein (TIGR03067 family)